MVRHKAGAEAVVTFGEDPREGERDLGGGARPRGARGGGGGGGAQRLLLGMLVMVAPPLFVLRADVPRKLAKAMAKAGERRRLARPPPRRGARSSSASW